MSRLHTLGQGDDLPNRLREACDGHPHAKIPWPHRLLHEAAEEILRLRKDGERFRYLQNVPVVQAQQYFWNHQSRKQRAEAIDFDMKQNVPVIEGKAE